MYNNFNRILLGSKLDKRGFFFNLLAFIKNSYTNFFSKNFEGKSNLHNILNNIFPIKIKNLNFDINYSDFKIFKPIKDSNYCIENGLTYSAELKIKFCLFNFKENYNKCQYLSIVDLPLLTNNSTFIINGIEKTIISKFTRSPGLYFLIENNKKKNYLIKIISDDNLELNFFINHNNLLILKVLNQEISIIHILRFMGLSKAFIIDKFYEYLYIYIENNKFYLKFSYNYFLNFSIPYDIKDEFGNIIINKNTILSQNDIDKVKSLNINKIEITEEYLINKFLASDIYLNNILIFKLGEKIDNTILSKLKTSDIKEIKLIYFSTQSHYSVLLSIINDNLNILDINKIVLKFFNKIGFYFIKKNFFNFSDFSEIKFLDISNIRKKINFKLLKNNFNNLNYFTSDDFLDIIKNLILFKDGLILEDDMQGLGALDLNLVGDYFYDIFYKFFNNLKKNLINKFFYFKNKKKFSCKDFLNFNILNFNFKNFFAFSKYSQYLDQINILSELAHKRRVTLLGMPGVSKKHSGFDIRDLNISYYSRLCPVETSEGINIGLVNSLALFAMVDKNKNLLAPYYKVINNKIYNNFVNYLNFLDEKNYIFCDNSVKLLPNNYIKKELINVRSNNQLILSKSNLVNYIDISPYQILSASTALIPFIEYDDSNRALMASNMLRQTLPCVIPERARIGTGVEKLIGLNSNCIIKSNSNGIIKFIDPELIIIKEFYKNKNYFNDYSFYNLNRHKSSNQKTDINQNFIVNLNDTVYVNNILSNGNCLNNNEIALGQNMLVAFMSWGGYNFEDSIIVSEKVLTDNRFTSLENFSLDINVYNNDEIYEELTNQIKFNSFLKNKLNSFGIIRLGEVVTSLDLLVGKKTYHKKNKKFKSNEVKILDSVLNKKDTEYIDSSYYLPNNFIMAEVVNTVVFFSKNHILSSEDYKILDFQIKKKIKKKSFIYNFFLVKFKKKIKKFLLNQDFLDNNNKIFKINKNILFKMNLKKISSLKLKDKKKSKIFKKFLKDIKKYIKDYNIMCKNINNIFIKDLPLNISKLIKIYFIRKKKLQLGDKLCGRHGNKGVISKIVPVNEMPYTKNGIPIDMILNPLGVPSRMNLGQLMEVHLGFASFIIESKLLYYLSLNNILYLRKFLFNIFEFLNYKKISLKIKNYSDKDVLKLSIHLSKGFYFGISPFNDFKEKDIDNLLKLVSSGFNEIEFSDKKKQVYLYDGQSGEKFDSPITIGYMYILKLNHLAEDKLHFRSVGPYSLITQQPLRGKSNLGGQRLGEMEVWALEAYGASYTLRDMLTIKSDDIEGRLNVYKNIVNNKFKFDYNIPESFNVMMNNINSTGVYMRFLDK